MLQAPLKNCKFFAITVNQQNNINFFDKEEIEEVLEQTDICYVTRKKKDFNPEEYEQAKGKRLF